MAVGSPRFRSFLASCATGSRRKTQRPKQRYLLCAPLPSAWNMASRELSQSISLCHWPHESVAIHQGQTATSRADWPRLDHQATNRVTPHTFSPRLARFYLRISRWRRNRPPHACSNREAHWSQANRPVARLSFTATPNPPLQGTPCRLRRQVPSGIRPPVAPELAR